MWGEIVAFDIAWTLIKKEFLRPWEQINKFHKSCFCTFSEAETNIFWTMTSKMGSYTVIQKIQAYNIRPWNYPLS